MIARLVPDTSQIRFWAQSALNGFETLEPDDALENARADLHALLDYINGLEGAEAIPVAGLIDVELRIALERAVREG